MKIKLFVLLFLVALTSMTFIPKGFSEEQSQYTSYRNNLITYQPQFTVEENEMLTRKEASQRMNESSNRSYNICTEEKFRFFGEACNRGSGILSFKTTDFEWYVWYKEVKGYSRFSPIKTYFAKFPINNDQSQTSYSLFSFQGFWTLHKVHGDVFDFLENTGFLSGYPETSSQVMVFQQHQDYPLIFDTLVSSRYGIGSTLWYFKNNILSIIHTTDLSLSGEITITKYSLLTGEVISIIGPEKYEKAKFDKAKEGLDIW